jgi:hypothetical protein
VGTGGLGGHGPGRYAEPCYFYFLKNEADAAAAKIGETYEITGTCRGYEKDKLFRGGLPGWDWHVDFEDCTVAPTKAGK